MEDFGKLRFTTTAKATKYVKILVYGYSGVGKTYLIQTAPKPLILSAEKGLLTLLDVDLPVIEIDSYDSLVQALDLIETHKKAKEFETICLDSISEIAEVILAEEKIDSGKDPRKAYGMYNDKLLPIIKRFRNIPDKHVYFTAKMERMTDDFTNITSFCPGLPGKKLGNDLPYLFDCCFPLRIGQDENGEPYRYLQTTSDIQYIAKGRGEKLCDTEPPDLKIIFQKILERKTR